MFHSFHEMSFHSVVRVMHEWLKSQFVKEFIKAKQERWMSHSSLTFCRSNQFWSSVWMTAKRHKWKEKKMLLEKNIFFHKFGLILKPKPLYVNHRCIRLSISCDMQHLCKFQVDFLARISRQRIRLRPHNSHCGRQQVVRGHRCRPVNWINWLTFEYNWMRANVLPDTRQSHRP